MTVLKTSSESQGQRDQSIWHYQPANGLWDEFLTPGGQVREHWRTFAHAVQEMGRREFDRRWNTAQQIVRNNAVTYNVYGDSRGTERLWPLDPIPLVISEEEWADLEQGIAQRAMLLNAVLNDAYGDQRLLRDHRLPPELLFSNPNFLRPCHGVRVTGDVRLHFYAVDLARSHDGSWWVIADRTQVPSGGGYALENRQVGARTLSNIFTQYSVRPLNQFFAARTNGLLSVAPGNRRMVLLTPGPYNETYFEHSYLAKTLSITLVEGPDLTVRDHRVYLKTLEGLEQVDLIFRRQDDSYCDPLELRGDSLLGIPGLMGAVRAGNVTIANSLGSGVVETPAHRAFLDGLCRHYFGEQLRIPSVATWWCGQPKERQYVLENLKKLIVKPAFPRFGQHPIFGANLDSDEREALARKILARPEQYVAQELIAMSTTPVWTEHGLAPRHVMLRAYACWDGHKYSIMPGGLTRFANSSDSMVVTMQHGGGSKDTWILGHGLQEQHEMEESAPAIVLHSGGDLPSRAADNLYWLGRYTERVESMIRIFRAVLPALAGEADVMTGVSLEAVLALLAGYGYLPATVLDAPIGEQLHQLESMLTGMVHDPTGITVLGRNLKQVRRSAWPLKARLSGDTWRVLQQIEFDSSQPVNPYLGKRPAAMLLQMDQSITLLSAFAGLLSESTTRGHGWRFLEIGKRIERALQSMELLRHGVAQSTSTNNMLELVLHIADSTITYRSRYFTVMRPAYVLDLLLSDETNPRSVGFQLASLAELADRLPCHEPENKLSLEKRMALKALTAVRLANTEDLIRPSALTAFLDLLRTDLHDFSEALTGRYLTHVMPSRLTIG